MQTTGTVLDPLPDAAIPAWAVFGSGAAYQPAVYPGAMTGSAGNSAGVTSDFIGGQAAGAAANLSYGAKAASKPWYDQPIFWAVAVFGIGVWLIAHIALVEVKS